uniref:Integrase zinc-binding domain-containing protein n=1 Tax=Anthurium amnicola TaxID=1678845 RepID=A0A1D1Z2F0_9ARAE
MSIISYLLYLLWNLLGSRIFKWFIRLICCLSLTFNNCKMVHWTHLYILCMMGFCITEAKVLLHSKFELTQKLFETYHSSKVGGHSGFRKTLHSLMQNVFNWKDMNRDVNVEI